MKGHQMKTIFLILTLVVGATIADARPAQQLSFTCEPGIFASLDTYIFTNKVTLHHFRLCNEPIPELTDAQGNVWFIWTFIDTPDAPGGDAYCKIEAQLNHVEGKCSAAVEYKLIIPDN